LDIEKRHKTEIKPHKRCVEKMTPVLFLSVGYFLFFFSLFHPTKSMKKKNINSSPHTVFDKNPSTNKKSTTNLNL